MPAPFCLLGKAMTRGLLEGHLSALVVVGPSKYYIRDILVLDLPS